jgi:hypothetical protein
VLLPPLLGVMDAFSDSLMVYRGPSSFVRDTTAVRMFAGLAALDSPDQRRLGPESRVLFRHLAETHPRFMQACVRNASDPSNHGEFGEALVRWLADLRPAGSACKSAAAGADYALLMMPEWSSLRKAAGCARVGMDPWEDHQTAVPNRPFPACTPPPPYLGQVLQPALPQRGGRQ